MKLYEAGEGIYRTHLTWDELELQFQELFGKDARFGENKKVTNIGDGRGFMSKMCLVEPDFPENVDAPKKFVVKICSLITMVEMTEAMKEKTDVVSPFSKPEVLEAMLTSVKKIHNTEATLYGLLAKYNNKHIPIAKVYHSEMFSNENESKAYLIMEFIEGTSNLNIYDNLKPEDLKQAMRAIAALEAVSLSFTEEEREFFNVNVFSELFAPVFSEEASLMYAKIPNLESTKAMVGMFRKFASAELGDRIDRLEAIIPELVDMDSFVNIGEELGIPKILAHGDMWSTNLLWRKKDEEMTLAAVVDFQTAHLGMPATDLVRILGASLQGKERQEHWESLVETFYDYLLEELNGRPAPYTLEQVKECYRRFFPLGGFLLVPMIGPLFEFNHNNNTDEVQRAKLTELILEKSRCLLDDIFENHERNKRIKQEKN